jgi:maleylpyruvate isomerase
MAADLPRELAREIDGVAAAHAALLAALVGLTDSQARAASGLPGWSIGHVLTHLARNADGMRGMLEAAAGDEMVAQYPGGMEQRNGDIAAGAGRPAADLVDDVRTAATAFEDALTTLTAAQWANGRGAASGGTVAISDVPFRRRREVVVHTTDLGLDDADPWLAWPADFVRAELVRMTMQWRSRRPMGLTDLPPQALAVPDGERLAWLMGRASIPGLEPAGLM